MELNYSKIFDKKIMQAVSAFCKLNKIEDYEMFVKKCFTDGFNIEKYGLLGKPLNDGEKDLKTDGVQEKWVEKEVIVEKRVEIPVEVIKEVIVEKEIIKEVPVEIIKEIEKVVTKIEYISDKTNENELGGKIANLEENIFHLNKDLESERKIFSTKTEEMEIFFQNEMSKKDEKLDEFRRTLDISRQTLADDGKLNKLQQTIQTLNSEIRDLKKINKELEKQLLDKPKQVGDISAKFYGSSNLNDDIYK